MSNKSAPPPVPEEYKGKSPAPPPPTRTSSQRLPPPAPNRTPELQRESSLRSRQSSQSNRAPPPTPNMAEIESARHAARAPRPPSQPKNEVEDLDALGGGKREALFFRKAKEYRRKVVECQKSKHALERAIICFVAVCLLWLTSLALCQKIVNTFVRGPEPDEVLSAGEKSIEGTQIEKQQHEACASRKVNICSLEFDARIEAEKAAVAAKLARNDILIEYLYHKRDNCSREVNSGVDTLAFLQKFTTLTNPEVTYATSITATDPRCLLVQEILKGGAGGIQALGATDRYIASADAQVNGAMNALSAREAYDQEYMANKTAQLAAIGNSTLGKYLNDTSMYFNNITSAYNVFMACNSRTKVYNGTVCPSESLLARAQEMEDTARARYNSMKTTAETWYADAKARVSQVNDFCKMLQTNSDLRQALNVFLTVNGFSSLEGMGLTSISVIPGLSLTSMVDINIDSYMADLEAQAQQYVQSVMAQMQRAALEQARLQQSQLNFSNDHPFPPYNPPPIDSNGTLSSWHNQSGPLMGEMATTLDGAAAKGGDQTARFVGEESFNTTANGTSQFLNNLQRRQFDFYIYQDVSARDIVDAWNSLIATALTFDYIFRVFRTLQIIRKYWRVSAIDLPPADVRTDLMQNKGLAVGHQNLGQKLAMCLAHPATTCLVMTIISLIMFSLLLSIYLPIYINYKAGCVDGDQTGNGTMISRNAYSISYSYAMSDGDKTITIGVDRINAGKEVICNEQFDYSSKAYEQQQREWDFIMRQHRDLQYRSFALHDCIDLPQVQAFNSSAAKQATGGNYTNLLQMLPGANCNYTFPELEFAVFNCSNIFCSQNLLCTGANQRIMKLETYRASCYAEWYLHASFLGSIMVVVTFILINCSRIFILRGLVRMFWRFLTDGRFSYLGTCDRLGRTKYPTIITEKGYSMKRAIRESLAQRIMFWEAKSTGLFIFGVLLNLPWMYTLGYLSSNLAVRDLKNTSD